MLVSYTGGGVYSGMFDDSLTLDIDEQLKQVQETFGAQYLTAGMKDLFKWCMERFNGFRPPLDSLSYVIWATLVETGIKPSEERLLDCHGIFMSLEAHHQLQLCYLFTLGFESEGYAKPGGLREHKLSAIHGGKVFFDKERGRWIANFIRRGYFRWNGEEWVHDPSF